MAGITSNYSFLLNLYRVAFLITGQEELSADVTVNALEEENGPEELGDPAARARLQKAVIAKATSF